jgi:uncharacterized protein YbjT (DUF2867 family)
MATVLVTGGTGYLGRELVPRLVAAGHDVRVLSRQANPELPAGVAALRGDLITGDGVEAAVDGAGVVAHLASDTTTLGTMSTRRGRRTEVEPTRRLLDVARRLGTPHVVYISIVGIDEIPLPYYRTKLATERVVEAAGVPYTIQRTTQWHTLAWDFAERLTRGPVAIVPRGLRGQLLDAGEVAERMMSLVGGHPAGRVTDMGGPAAIDFERVVRDYLRVTNKRRPVIALPLPGKTMRAFREGHNLALDHADGRITWSEWLAARTT